MLRPLTVTALLLSLTFVGTLWFRLVEGQPWLDCLYLAVLILTTVGLTEVFPLSEASRLFVVFYLVGGLGAFTYSAYQLGNWIVNTQVRSLWERRRMEKAIAKLHDHFIVCGMGRMGRTICHYFAERGRPFVVVDNDEETAVPYCEENNWLHVLGDATDDHTLTRAGIDRAGALTSVLSTDADNVYVVLSARMLNTNLQIVARAGEEKAIQKIERAGATRVVSPFSSGAEKMARFMLNPSIEDFLEIADAHGNELELADVQIDADSPYVGKQLTETDLRDKGVMVIGIRRANGERLMPPPGSTVLHSGDSLFAFGSSDAVNAMISDVGPTGS
jgi:voltage-gated potassium channel